MDYETQVHAGKVSVAFKFSVVVLPIRLISFFSAVFLPMGM